MVANFDTILLGQQPCQAVQINWPSEIKYISITRVQNTDDRTGAGLWNVS
jgi:hypothetical protein